MEVLTHINETYGSSIKSREAVREIFAQLNPEVENKISFRGIEFVSRSVVDQFIAENKSFLEETGRVVEFVEMAASLKKFFDFFENREIQTPVVKAKQESNSPIGFNSFLQLSSF